MWLNWTAWTAVGHMVGQSLDDPSAYGIDLLMIAFFAAMLAPLARGRREAKAWIVAGVVALGWWSLLPGPWFVVAGALAGAFTSACLDDRDA